MSAIVIVHEHYIVQIHIKAAAVAATLVPEPVPAATLAPVGDVGVRNKVLHCIQGTMHVQTKDFDISPQALAAAVLCKAAE